MEERTEGQIETQLIMTRLRVESRFVIQRPRTLGQSSMKPVRLWLGLDDQLSISCLHVQLIALWLLLGQVFNAIKLFIFISLLPAAPPKDPGRGLSCAPLRLFLEHDETFGRTFGRNFGRNGGSLRKQANISCSIPLNPVRRGESGGGGGDVA